MQAQSEALGSATPVRPRMTFDEITFSGQQKLQLGGEDIVVFVGPNNAGKSAALRNLEQLLRGPQEITPVIRKVAFRIEGTPASFMDWLETNALTEGNRGSHAYRGMNYSIHHTHVQFFTSAHPHKDDIANFFSSRVGTETRLTGSDPAGAIRLHFQAAEHPIHLLLADDIQADRLSAYFQRAFGEGLIVFRAGGASFPLLVGKKPPLGAGENEFSKRYVEELMAKTVPLQSQGDGMRSFATVLLHVLVAENYSVQFLDEPEAFLHPPQARLLGEYITKERQSKAQLFVATHSPDVLQGILAADPKRVRIVRIQREGELNKIKELSSARTAAIASDPLTRYSGVLSGLFHQRVVVAESDSDCLFYNAILNTTAVSGTENPDVLFIHAGGKDRMKDLAGLLRELDVPVSVIADIDILNDGPKFQQLFETLGGAWADIEQDWTSLNNVVVSTRPPLSADNVRSRIESELADVSGSRPFPKIAERNIKSVFKQLSPWQQVKSLGRLAIPRGEPLKKFDRIAEKCGARGLWIVPVGELEGFCRSIEAGHGPDFTEKVLSQRNIETDNELAEAREFIRKLWVTKPD